MRRARTRSTGATAARAASLVLALAMLPAAPVSAAPPVEPATRPATAVEFDSGLYLAVRGWSLLDGGRIRLEFPGGAIVVPADRVERVVRDGRAVWTAADALASRASPRAALLSGRESSG